MTLLPRLLSRPAVALAAVVVAAALPLTAGAAAAPAAVATAAETTTPATAERSSLCNVHHYSNKVRDVRGERRAFLVRLAVEDYPGRTTVKKGTRITSLKQLQAKATVKAQGSVGVGGSAVLKKIVNVFADVNAGASLRTSLGGSYEKYKDVYVTRKLIVPKAASVAWYRGYQYAAGTAEVSRCDAYDGRGDGRVVWTKVSWTSYNTVPIQGGWRCDLPAQNVVAQAAKKEVCIKRG